MAKCHLRAACFYCFPHQVFLFSALGPFPSHTPPLKFHPIGPGICLYNPYFIVQNVCGSTRWGVKKGNFSSGFSAFSLRDSERECFVLLSIWPGSGKNCQDIIDQILDDSAMDKDWALGESPQLGIRRSDDLCWFPNLKTDVKQKMEGAGVAEIT